MAAADNLSERQFFHGTRHSFRNGQIIDPAKHPFGYDSHLYMTPQREAAESFAEGAHGPKGNYDAPPRVYRVQPLDSVETDPHEADDGRDFFPGSGGRYRGFRTNGKVRVLGRV